MLKWSFLVLGVWTLISPWILGFNDVSLARLSSVAVGTLLTVLSMWYIFGEKIN